MISKATKKLSALNLNSDQVIKPADCAKVKGGYQYWCCTRNKWITV